MSSTVTFKNLDILDSRSVEQAAGILWAAHRHAKQSVELFGESEAEVRERLARPHTFTLHDTHAEVAVEDGGTVTPTSVPTKLHAQGFYRGNTRDLVDAMLTRIDKHGSATLEDTATDMGITLDTARAFLRNAGRTNRAHGTELPFVPRWNHDKGCNDYVAR
jgi:hypothetical protein